MLSSKVVIVNFARTVENGMFKTYVFLLAVMELAVKGILEYVDITVFMENVNLIVIVLIFINGHVIVKLMI